MTRKGNPKPHDNPPNPVPNLPSDTDSYPSLSYSSSTDSYDSSDDKYYKRRRRAKKDKNKRLSTARLYDPIKECVNLTAKLLTATYKSKVIRLKLDEDPL